MPGSTVQTETGETTKDDLSKLYHVIILNDEEHTFEYVIEMLQAIFGFSHATALAHTTEADTTGSSFVWTCGVEEAEQMREQIDAFGQVCRMLDSRVSVVV